MFLVLSLLSFHVKTKINQTKQHNNLHLHETMSSMVKHQLKRVIKYTIFTHGFPTDAEK